MSSSKTSHVVEQLVPLQLESAIVGLALDEVDQSTIEYLNFFRRIIPIGKVKFVHYLEQLSLYSSLYDLSDVGLLDAESRIQERSQQIIQFLSNYIDLGRLPDWTVEVRLGNPLHALREDIKEAFADLTIIGKSTKYSFHGISGKRFVRHAHSDALIVPDRSRPLLNRILVPFDFSPRSVMALRAALAIKAQHKEAVEITAFHVFEVPSVNWYRIQRSEAQMEEMLRQDREEAFDKLLKKEFSEHWTEVKYVAKAQKSRTVGRQIIDYANQHDSHLIVMGAKGHSGLEHLMLGSVAEKVISLTTEIPVLVIR